MNTLESSPQPWERISSVSVNANAQAEANVIELPLMLRLWRILVRRRWLIVGSIILVTILGLLYSFTRTPLYTASSRLEISRDSAQVVNIQSVERETSEFDLEFYQTQYGLLASNALAEQVVRNMRLQDDPMFKGAYGIEDAATSEEEGPRMSPAELRQAKIRQAVDIVLGSVEIAPIRSSRLVDIAVTTPDPALSARIANAWGANFIEMNLKRRYEANSYAREFLEDRLEQLRQRLEDSERDLVAYASAQNIINLEQATDTQTGRTLSQRSLQADQLATLNEELAKAEADRIRVQAMPRSGTASAEALTNATLASLRDRRAAAQAEYQKLLTQFEPNYPPAQALKNQVDALDTSIAREESRISATLGGAATAAGARETALRARVASLTGDLSDLRRRSIQYNIYQREVDTNRVLYDGLLQRYKEIGIAGGVGTNNISVVDNAEVPEGPSSPNHALNLLASLLLGAVLGAALAMLMEQIDEGITEPTDVGRVLHAPLLGVIPTTEDGDPIAALNDLRSSLVESYIAVQTNLDLSTAHGAPASLSVTSTRPQEGKSTTAFALAHTLARSGRKIVLIDGDMRSPSVHHEFGIKNGEGLSNALTGHDNVQELLHQTSNPNLRYMTAGPQPPNAADLLVGNRLQIVIKKLLDSGIDHVIIDSPPVLGLADAPLIAAAVEGTIYAVEARAIRTSRVRTAMQRLRGANINLLGVVLTKFSTKHTQYSYAYDYKYGYGKSTVQA
ncbi:GumC family protein [Tsuneonella sp. HG222]